jgi:hypothetical protein
MKYLFNINLLVAWWGRVYRYCGCEGEIVGEPFGYAQGIARPYRNS